MYDLMLLFCYVAGALLAAGYALPLAIFARGMRVALRSEEGVAPEAAPFVSVIVAARNEEAHVAACLKALAAQTYPGQAFEIVLVDDGSMDSTVRVAEEAASILPVSISVLHLPANFRGKKEALAFGVTQARGGLLAFTDADCEPEAGWLSALIARLEPNTGMVAGPVVFRPGRSALSRCLALEFAGFAGVSAGSIEEGIYASCSGGSLLVRRDAFDEAGGYEAGCTFSSGDDELLMHAIAATGRWEITWCGDPTAVVMTDPPASFSGLVAQRARWASKRRAYRRLVLQVIHWLAVLFVLALILVWIAAPFVPALLPLAAVMLFVKMAAELAVLVPATRFFEMRRLLPWFLPSQILQLVYVGAALAQRLTGPVLWKNRPVRAGGS